MHHDDVLFKLFINDFNYLLRTVRCTSLRELSALFFTLTMPLLRNATDRCVCTVSVCFHGCFLALSSFCPYDWTP
jgi:hypothetical protein